MLYLRSVTEILGQNPQYTVHVIQMYKQILMEF